MCLKTADVASEDVWGIMLTWRGRSLVHVHTARALFFIILIILKAKLIFLIYLISTPRRASCKIYQNPYASAKIMGCTKFCTMRAASR